MIFLVSGEGSSDIGVCTNQERECSGADFRPGPMAVIIDQIVEREIEYSLHAIGALEFTSRSSLDRYSKETKTNFLPGKKQGMQMGLFVKTAFVFGKLAQKRGEEMKCPVGAVLFHDTDGTRSTERGLYEDKWNAIERGFAVAKFPHGVPMLPKPKSEAWIICALKPNPYQNCEGLEESLSGNDNAPNSAKDQQDELLAARGKEVRDLSQMVEDGVIDPGKIIMTSFNRFNTRLREVTLSMLGRQPTA